MDNPDSVDCTAVHLQWQCGIRFDLISQVLDLSLLVMDYSTPGCYAASFQSRSTRVINMFSL